MVRLPGIAQMLGASRGGACRRGCTHPSVVVATAVAGVASVVVAAAVAGARVVAVVEAARAGVVAAGTGVVDVAAVVVEAIVVAVAVLPVVVLDPRRDAGAARITRVLGLVAGAGDVDAGGRRGGRAADNAAAAWVACVLGLARPEMSTPAGASSARRSSRSRSPRPWSGVPSSLVVVVSVVPVVGLVSVVATGESSPASTAAYTTAANGPEEDGHGECHELAHGPSIGAGRPAAGQARVRSR